MADDDKDPLDADAAIARLNAALPLQLRSAAAYTLASAAMVGFQYAGLSEALWGFAQRELEDARRLAEKIVTLGGKPASDVAPFEADLSPEHVVDRLIGYEREAAEALQDVIPTTGNTADSEALEHRLEHVIMRKQEQIDLLERARRTR